MRHCDNCVRVYVVGVYVCVYINCQLPECIIIPRKSLAFVLNFGAIM